MKVKICGVTDSLTAVKAAKLGADAIGFVFAESKRRVSVEGAKEIIGNLPNETMKIGVFVNEKREEMERIANEVGLTHFQLHGDEGSEFCRSLSLPVIKAFSISADSNFESIRDYPSDYILLDSKGGPYRGGNGTTFDWGLVEKNLFDGKKIILAGGLHEQNVRKGIADVNPHMVDVSSGVETNGMKDLQKIKSFIMVAKKGMVGNEFIHNA